MSEFKFKPKLIIEDNFYCQVIIIKNAILNNCKVYISNLFQLERMFEAFYENGNFNQRIEFVYELPLKHYDLHLDLTFILKGFEKYKEILCICEESREIGFCLCKING